MRKFDEKERKGVVLFDCVKTKRVFLADFPSSHLKECFFLKGRIRESVMLLTVKVPKPAQFVFTKPKA